MRVRLVSCERLRRPRVLGETVLRCTTELLLHRTSDWLTLQPCVDTEVGRLSSRWIPANIPTSRPRNSQLRPILQKRKVVITNSVGTRPLFRVTAALSRILFYFFFS